MRIKFFSQEIYENNTNTYWSAISRTSNLLMVTNIAFFVTTKLILKGYYFTIISMSCLALVILMCLIPVAIFRRLWYYLIALGLVLISIYFLLASIIYFLTHPSVG